MRGFYNAQLVSWLASDWKVDVVRAAMAVEPEQDFWNDERGYINDPVANKNRVTAVVDAAITSGIYAIIDWHSHDAESFQQQAISFFEEMAQKYKNVPNVIYEIYNEPLGPADSWQTIKPYMQAVTNAIRAIDAQNLIIIGTPVYSQRVDVAAEDPVQGANLAYALHFYAGTTSHRATLRDYAYIAMSRGQAVFVSEFGTSGSSGDGSYSEPETNIWFSFLDQFKISWVNWSISTDGKTSSALKSGASVNGNWNSGNLSASGAYIRGKLLSPPGSETVFYTLSINKIGEGTIGSSPNSILVQKGATVQLTAFAARNWTFQGWSGDVTSADNRPSFTMDGNKEVTATFVSSSSALPSSARGGVARWSVRRAGGALSLSGPPDAPAAVAALYDTRGKAVRSFSVKNGQATVSGVKLPSGSYVLVVKNRSTGREMYKTRVSFVD
jgi:hypothetical protein